MLKPADQPGPGRKRKRLRWALLALSLPAALLICALVGTGLRWSGRKLTTGWRYLPPSVQSDSWANWIYAPRRSSGPDWERRGHLLMVRLGRARLVAEYWGPQSSNP